MTNPGWTYRWGKIAAAGLIGLAVAAGAASGARAADDDDDDQEAFDTKIIRQLLHGLGLRRDGAGIDYRERSPLVVPPSRDLPPPETGSVAQKTAAWPNDPDVKRAKELKAQRKKPTKTVEDEWFPLRPDELGPRHKTAPAHQIPTTAPPKDPTAPSTWSELNAKSFFSFGGLFGTKQETATFTGEPPRTSLTEPPVGYRTPSPTYSYGVGVDKNAGGGPINPMDHASSNTDVPR